MVCLGKTGGKYKDAGAYVCDVVGRLCMAGEDGFTHDSTRFFGIKRRPYGNDAPALNALYHEEE